MSRKEKLNLDFNLTSNFKLKEAVEWANHISTMSFADKTLAIKLATEAAKDFNTMNNIMRIAIKLQEIRNKINVQFPSYNGNIGIRVTSWLRPVEWEKHRRRNGTSQHTTGHAVDFRVVGVSNADYNRIMQWLFNYLNNWDGGLARSMNGSNYTFIHLDLGKKRRWTY